MTILALPVLVTEANPRTDTEGTAVASADASLTLFKRLGVTALPAHETRHLPVERLLVPETPHILRAARRLVKSIQQVGVLQSPSVVLQDGCPIHDPDATFTVIAGRRRVLAARFAGLTVIKCEVYASSTLPLSALLTLIENTQRSAAWVQEVGALRQLLDEKVGLTPADLAVFGFDRVHLAERLKIAQLPPPLLSRVLAGTVSRDVARKLVRLTPSQQERVVQLANEGEEVTAEGVKEVLRVQIASGLLPLQATLAQSLHTAPLSTVTASRTSSPARMAQEEALGKPTQPAVQLPTAPQPENAVPEEGQALQEVLQAVCLFQQCAVYRTVPRAIQTLTEALAQQVRLALRCASMPEHPCALTLTQDERDA